MIPREAKKSRVDVLFHTKFTLPLFSTVKSVMVLHGSEWYVYPGSYSSLDIRYIKMVMPLYCKKATRIISNSDMTKRD